MKRILLLLCCFAIVCTFSACSQNTQEPSSAAETSNSGSSEEVAIIDDMNTGTITTLGFVFLIFLILSAANRTISRVMGLAGICILAVIFLQARSGVNLVDFSNIGDSITDLGFKIAAWAEDKLWPSINELARWLETNFL